MTMLSDATGINFRFFQSELKDGKYTSKYTGDNGQSPNGFYKNGEIYVDINAGNNGEGLILFTVSHELAHFMRDFAPEHSIHMQSSSLTTTQRGVFPCAKRYTTR